MPSQPSLRRGWLRERVASDSGAVSLLRSSLEHPLVRRAFPSDVADNLLRLWAERDAFLDTLDHLPQTLCHLDAFHRNLFARCSADDGYQTVAID